LAGEISPQHPQLEADLIIDTISSEKDTK